MSAKKPRKVKERQKREADERERRARGGEAQIEDESRSEGDSGEDDGVSKPQSQDPKDASKAGESVLD